MTIEDAAHVLKCSRDSLYRAIRQKQLRPRRWFKKMHVTVEDLYKWKQNRYSRANTKIDGKLLYDPDNNRFSVSDVAHMLGVPTYTIHNMIHHGKIKSTKVGKFHILCIEEIEKAKDILQFRDNQYRWN